MISLVQFGITYHIQMTDDTLTKVKSSFSEHAGDKPLWTIQEEPQDSLDLLSGLNFEEPKPPKEIKVRVSERNKQMTVITGHEAVNQSANIGSLEKVFTRMGLVQVFEQLLDVFPYESTDNEVVINLSRKLDQIKKINSGKTVIKSTPPEEEATPLTLPHDWINPTKLNEELPSSQGCTQLTYAVETGDIESLKFLLAMEGTDVNKKDAQSRTALGLAVEKNNIEAVALLLAHEDIEPQTPSSWNGSRYKYYPLSIAVDKEANIDMVKQLLRSPKVKVQFPSGTDEIKKLLRSYGGEPEKIWRNAGGKLAKRFIQAIDSGDDLTAIATINHPKFDPNVDDRGITGFYWACNKGKLNLVERMLHHKEPNINTQKQMNLYTPLAAACEEGSLDIVKLLLKQPDINPFLKVKNGKTPVELARTKGHEEIAVLIEEYIKENF